MSLIIENKEALDSIADAIIKANLSEQNTSATKSQLIEMIKNIIPQTTKFASGTFIPAEDISDSNGPIISYAVGTDENGKAVLPDLVFVFQPYALCPSEHIDAAAFLVYGFSMEYHAQNPVMRLIFKTTQKPNSSGRYGSGSINGYALGANYVYEEGFRICGMDTGKFQAQHPIVWMQFKF